MENTLKLLCFPYAGGSSFSIYRQWTKWLSPIQLIPIELPGRGSRMEEPLLYSLEELEENLFQDIVRNHIQENDRVALFGHSMGSLLAYRIGMRIGTDSPYSLVHTFLSGFDPLHLPRKKVYHRMSDREFMHEICELGGTPIEAMQHEVIRNTFLPILRADTQVVETYLESKRNVADRKLACDMSVLYGFHDNTMSDRIHSWNRYTHGRTEFKGFEGDHFFIVNDNQREVPTYVRKVLMKKLAVSI
ncbi:thioesterase II family protein [Paenibacillus sp. IHBB 10380]|uniref:thioesterase II family protein n=1 Tax=Paenibacillus sp. IHBB 10380 TaxID=1566358 RepID=UPI0005CFB353|nr:thioesterase domain-containing protein [Paenibacillus sp. IHBB 10380]AJS58933.1 hypothetical protein UB51_11100 [Paenibacillus sp. IHBB 10380]